MAYNVSFTRRVQREFVAIHRSANPATRRNLDDAMARLEENPYPLQTLAGSQDAVRRLSSGEWRIRVGNYRIRYRIDDDSVVVTRVAHRSAVYRDL